MAQINASGVMQKLIDELQLYPAQDFIPNQLADKIVPVFQVNSEAITLETPPATVVKTVTDVAQNTGINNTLIYTTPATGDFYLTNVALSLSNPTAGGLWDKAYILATIDGVVETILGIATYTGSSIPSNSSVSLFNPVKVDPATQILLSIDCAYDDSDAYGIGTIIGFNKTI